MGVYVLGCLIYLQPLPHSPTSSDPLPSAPLYARLAEPGRPPGAAHANAGLSDLRGHHDLHLVHPHRHLQLLPPGLAGPGPHAREHLVMWDGGGGCGRAEWQAWFWLRSR